RALPGVQLPPGAQPMTTTSTLTRTEPEPVAAPPRRRSRPGIRLLRYGLLLLFLCVILMPAYVLILTSFKGPGDATPARAWLLPTAWETDGWVHAWNVLSPSLWRTFALVIPA